jgi:glucosamine-6-phosphate deaminase
MTTIKADQLEVIISNSRMLMGEAAAIAVASKIRELLSTKEEINIVFAAAPSQNEFLASLIKEEGIHWNKINAFHMDEYIDLPATAPQGFGYFLRERLFGQVEFKTVHYLNGNANDPEAECLRYARLLEDFPVDIVCLGIGENCHLAFNDPHVAFFDDPLTVKQVELDLACRQQQVNDGCFTDLSEVPVKALTITIPALLKSTCAFCIVPGEKKAEAIRHTLEDRIQELYPSTIMRNHPNAILFIDKDSAGRLSPTSSLMNT